VYIRHPKDHVPYSLYIPGEDHENYDISIHFDTASNFIHQSRQETNILVHCMAGISRSVTLVLAYLMKHKCLTYREATSMVAKNRRKVLVFLSRLTLILDLLGSL
jgi:protein-tyrosine phosphatase